MGAVVAAPVTSGRQLNPESGAQAGPCGLAPRAHRGPRRAGARACPTRRPGVWVTPSARLGSWQAATTWWVRPRQECGASSMGSLASPAPRPGRRVVSSLRGGASHLSWGAPGSSQPSAGHGAVRRAVPSGHEHDGVRVGLLSPKAAGDSSSWTPGLCAALWRAATSGFRVIPAAHNGPAASSKATAVQALQRLIELAPSVVSRDLGGSAVSRA